MTCLLRLRDWNEVGVWQRHEVLLAELNEAARLDWSRAVVDSSHVRALKEGSTRAARRSTGPTGLETRPDHRRPQHTAGSHPHRREPKRRHPAPAADRRDPDHSRPARSPSPKAGLALCGPRLRPRHLPRPGSAPPVSCRPSPAAARDTAPAVASTAGSSSAPSPDSTASSDSACAGNAEPTSTKPSSNSPAS